MFHKTTTDHFRHRGLMPVVLSALLLRAGLSGAAEPVPPARYSIEQPAQELDASLRAIAHKTSTSVLFDPGAVRGRRAPAVSGQLSAVEAVRAVLRGSDLAAEQTREGVIVVRPLSTPASGPASSPGTAAPVSMPVGDVGPGALPRHQPAGDGPAAESADEGSAIAPLAPHESSVLTKVEVTGSRLKRVNEGPAPVNVYTRRDIERSGQPNLERFLASLNEVSASPGEGGFGSTIGQSTVQLRGLPIGTTLVLINGRRLEAAGSSSANFFNLNLIPTAAIDRVEIVPVGSSAVYGGDALAGVVNVILKKSLQGPSISTRLGTGRGFRDGALSLATGGEGAQGRYLLMGSYSRSTPLTMAERDFFVNADYRRFGGVDARVRNCTPGTVSSVSGGNLPGLNASFAAIPQLASGQVPKVSDFQATAGTANLCNLYANNQGFALVYGYETFGLHALGERKFSGSWSVFGELTLAKERMQAHDTGLTLSSVTVPATNPFNPFGQDVKVTTVLGPDNGERGSARQTRFNRALVGARGDLTSDWDAEVTVSTVRDDGGAQTFDANVNAAARAAALAATSPGSAINPFTTGRAASDAVIGSVWSDSLRFSHGRKDQLGAVARGSLAQLPAGRVEAVVGLEGADDHYDVILPGQYEINDSRRSTAFFGELRAPLLSGGSGGAGGRRWDLAALSLAGRRDHYSDFGSANTYQAGLEFRPIRDLLLRASTASSFKPPTLVQTNVTDTTYDAVAFGLRDPARGGQAVTSGTVVRTVNRDLEPEHGRSYGFGAVWEPAGFPGTHVGLSQWKVRIDGLISLLSAQTVLDNESLFSGFVTRGPAVNGMPGPVTNVKLAEVNFGSVDVSGTDVEAAYVWKGWLGRWTASASATRTRGYKVVLAPGAAEHSRLGRRYSDFWAPRWKGRLSIGLEQGAWSLVMTSRFLGHYLDAGTSTRQLGGYWLHDLAASLNLKKFWPSLGAGLGVKAASLSLSIANLADREPGYVSGAPYYDITQSDWRGRYAAVRASVDW